MKIVQTKTEDGFFFNGLYSEAHNSKKIIIHIHGMAGNPLINSFYPEMHERYPDNGISFLVGEHRGSNVITDFVHEEEDKTGGNAFEIFEESHYDIQAWIDFAKSKGYEEIWLQSHSLGPSKVAYFLHKTKSPDVVGVLFISPADMIGLVQNREGKNDHDILFPEAQNLVKAGKGTTLLSNPLWGYALLSANTYLNFFGEESNLAIFNFNDDSLGWDVVNDISVPVLAITGTNDDAVESVMEPHEAMQKLEKELLKSPRVKTVVIDGAEHSFDGFAAKIVEEVINFIS